MLFSFIIPMYHAKGYVKQCLTSIERQGFRDFEVILVDDASTDGTAVICEQEVGTDCRFRYIRLEEHRGVSAARNEGLKIASGEWVWFVDADDWVEPEALGILAEATVHGTDMIAFDYIKERGGNVRVCANQTEEPVIDGLEFRGRMLGTGCNFQSVWSNLYRRQFLLENELYFDETLSLLEDAEFTVRVGSVLGQCQFVRQPLYHYVVHMDSASQQWKEGFGTRNLQAAEKIQQYLEECHEPVVRASLGHFMQDVLKVVILKDIFHPSNPLSWMERKGQMDELLKKEFSAALIEQTYEGNAAQKIIWFCIAHRWYVPLALASRLYYGMRSRLFWRLYARIYRV